MPHSHPLEHSAYTYLIEIDSFVNITFACHTPILVSISSPARRTTATVNLPFCHFTINWAKSYDVGFVFDQVLHFPRGPFIYYVSSYFGLDKFWYFWIFLDIIGTLFDIIGHIWTFDDIFDCFWQFLNILDNFLIFLDIFDPFPSPKKRFNVIYVWYLGLSVCIQ